MWKPFIKLLKAISSNTDPGAIAAGVAAGMLVGFLPKDNVLWYLVSIFILFLYIQRASFLLSVLAGSLLTVLLDPVFDSLGFAILSNKKLIPLFSKMLDIPFFPLIKFNNTVVMGSFVFGLVLYIPLFYAVKGIVILWRKYAAAKFMQLKIVLILKKIPLINKIKNLMLLEEN